MQDKLSRLLPGWREMGGERCWKGWGQRAGQSRTPLLLLLGVQGLLVAGTEGQSSNCPTSPSSAMAENSDKVPITIVGPDDIEFCSPPAYATVTVKPSGSTRLLKVGAVVLISGAVLLLFGAIGAFYFWKGTDNHIYNVHYTMSINGKLQDGSMEIDAGNNLETFKMGSGAEEAIEVNDFQNGITGVRFAGGEKCYIKAQVKARVPEVGTATKQSISSELEGKIMPVKDEENSLIWVAMDQPVKDNSFLSSKILELCGNLPIFWLKPMYPKEIQRERRDVVRNTAPSTTRRPHSEPRGNPGPRRLNNETRPSVQDDEEPFNPDNPYHQQEGESMTFDPRLDHEGICCIECRRSYTHCQKICEPLGGYYPWPYNYQGCRSACRVVMPCSWWVARILGMV